MSAIAAFIVVATLILGVFAALNWSAVSAPVSVSLGVASFDAPLGLILLAFALGYAAVLLAYAATQRTTLLVESRRHTQELRVQREIAERAESSRLSELTARLESEFAGLRASISESEAELRRSLEETANGLAASVAQVDDKLNRLSGESDRIARSLPASPGRRV